MKIFTIGNYKIKAEDELNWILEEKKKKRPIPPGLAKNGVRPAKSKQKWILVGYYSTLLALKKELIERRAKKCKSFKELSKWVNEIKKI